MYASVVGAKDEGSEKFIRGATVGLAYGDELVLTPRSFFEMMLGRMSPEGARLYGTTNPDTPYHWLYQDYINNDEKNAAGLIESIKFNLKDNLSLSEEVRHRYETQFKGVFKQRMIDGLWVVAQGAIYRDCYDPDVIDYDDDERPISLTNSGGFVDMAIPVDYGTTNPCRYLHVVDDGTTYWVDDEYYWDSKETMKQQTDGQYATDLIEFRDKHAPQGAVVIIDPSAASLKQEMSLRGIWHMDADNNVEDGIRKVASLLCPAQDTHSQTLHKMLRLEFANLQALDEKAELRGEDIPLKVHDHAPDALRYFCP